MNDRSAANLRENHHGNQHDEHGGSYYVLDANDEKIAGPFGSAPYCATVCERMEDQGFESPHVEYET